MASKKNLFHATAFFAVVLIGIALLIQVILRAVGVTSGFVDAVKYVGEVTAIIISLIVAFFYVRAMRKNWVTIVYAIATTAIIALYIVNITLISK